MTLPSSHPSNDNIINDFNIVATVGGFLFAVMATFGWSVWAGLAFLVVTALLVITVHLWRRSGSSQPVVIPNGGTRVSGPSSTTLLPSPYATAPQKLSFFLARLPERHPRNSVS